MSSGFVRAVISGGSVAAVAGIILIFLMKEDKKDASAADDGEPNFQLSDLGKLLKMPVVWVVALTIFCGYGYYTSTSYFNPFLTEVIGVSPGKFRPDFDYQKLSSASACTGRWNPCG